MLPNDVTASISLFHHETHGYTVQTSTGSHIAQGWDSPAAALFAACDHVTRVLGDHGPALVMRAGGEQWARIDLDCPPHAEMIEWRPVAAASAAA